MKEYSACHNSCWRRAGKGLGREPLSSGMFCTATPNHNILAYLGGQTWAELLSHTQLPGWLLPWEDREVP